MSRLIWAKSTSKTKFQRSCKLSFNFGQPWIYATRRMPERDIAFAYTSQEAGSHFVWEFMHRVILLADASYLA